MFPSSGYFRGVNCPFFASGLCDRVYCHFRHSKPQEEKAKESLQSLTAQTGPSYSFNSSQISGFSTSPYLQKNIPGSVDSHHSSKETPPQSINSVESLTSSQNDSSPVSIPSFTELPSVLPESVPEPQIDRQSLPKISGLAKRKSHAPPQYKPTPKNQISDLQTQLCDDAEIPSYHPTPKHSSVNKKSVIQYDPEKNYAVNQKAHSSSDEDKEAKQPHSFLDTSIEEAEFSEEEEAGVKENDKDNELKDFNTNNFSHSSIPNYADFLTPSSYFTSKLSNISSNVSPGGENNKKHSSSSDSGTSSTSRDNGTDIKKSGSKSRHLSSTSKSSSKTKGRDTSLSSKSTTENGTKSSSQKHSTSSSKPSSSEKKAKSPSDKHSSSSNKSSSSQSKVKSLCDKESSSSSKSKSTSSQNNKVNSPSGKESSSSSKSSSSQNRAQSTSDKNSSSSSKTSSSHVKSKSSSPRESSSSSRSQKETKCHTSSTSGKLSPSSSGSMSNSNLDKTHCNGYSSKNSTPDSERKSDHNKTLSNSKHSLSKCKEKESHSNSNTSKTRHISSESKSLHLSSSSSKLSGAKQTNGPDKHQAKSSHSVSSINSLKELKRSSSDIFHEKLKNEVNDSKKISRSLSSNVEVKKSKHINDVKEERRHSSENKKEIQFKSHSMSGNKDKNNEKSKTATKDNDRRRSLDQDIKDEVKSKVRKRRVSDITSDLFGEGSDGSDSDVQIIEPPPQPPPEVLELTDSDEEQDVDLMGSGLLKEDDFDFSDTNTFDECLRIFQETDRKLKLATVKTERNKEPEPTVVSEKDKEVVSGKKRMAHPSAQQVIRPFKPSPQTKPRLSAAEVMHNRIVEMQKRALFRAAKREGREADLPGTIRSKSAVTNSTSESGSGSKLLPDVASASAASLMSGQKKREAHLPSTPTKITSNANTKNMWSPNSFYSKKKPAGDGRLEQTKTNTVTIASTASKVEKRKAHVPTNLNLKRPMIPAGNSSKVPVNVRQRYLNLIIDEFLKFCQEETAFQKGQEEEQEVYNRATNKNIYLRVAVNAIKRVRTEAAMSQPSSSKKSKMTLSSLASQGSSTVTQSHEATLGGSLAAKTSFTLNRSGASRLAAPINFKGLELYNRLKKHILSEEQLRENGYPRPSEDGKSKAQFYTSVVQDLLMKDNERICRRCGKRYYVTEDGTPVVEQECIYHYSNIYKKKVAGSLDSRYGCCNEKTGVKGCQVSSTHVNEKNKYENLNGYMKTLPAPESDPKNNKVFSLDCEMVYTKAGLELARVTVIGDEKQVVYETLVKPDTAIIDYNTRFSGIKASDMKGVVTTLRGVQAVILSMVSDKTILMGHSLESDFTALKLIHSTVVDTALVFPHRLGLPFKRALRNLALDYLQKIIQADDSGHDSKEDAVSCMDLMIYKVKEEAKSEVRRF